MKRERETNKRPDRGSAGVEGRCRKREGRHAGVSKEQVEMSILEGEMGGERQERRAVTAESLRDVSVFMAGKI